MKFNFPSWALRLLSITVLLVLLLLITVIVLLRGSSRGLAYQSMTTVPSEITAAVSDAILPDLQNHHLAGVAVGVIKDGQRYVFGYGRRSLWGGADVNNRTEFELGSITKTFTSQVLAQMVLERKLSLDQPAQGLLPGVTFPEFEGTPITLRQLASHSSGLPYMPADMDMSPRLSNLNPFKNYSEEHLHAWVSNYKLTRKPGTKYEYSNAGMALLGQLLAAQAGVSYEDLIARRITAPLGMHATQITLSPENAAHYSHGYFLYSLAGIGLHIPIPPWEMPGFAPAGAIHSDTDDMLIYLGAAMGNDTPLHDAFALETQQFGTANPQLSVGLAWHAYIAADGGEPIIWHNGATGGFSTFAGFLRDAKIGVVVLANTLPGLISGGVNPPAVKIFETLTGRHIVVFPPS